MAILKLISVLVFLSTVLRVQSVKQKELPVCNFRAVYMFGDSNSDTGGNSAAFWVAGPPAGETFFHRPVGRGSDGRLIIDFIAEHLGLPYLSPYLDSIGTNFRHGANFAIGGTTIRPQNESMSLHGIPPFSLDVQATQFRNFKVRSGYFYKQAKRDSERRNLPRPQDFSSALYIFDIGQNDVAAGLRMNNDGAFHEAMPEIVEQLAEAVKSLHKEGARIFWIHNTGPIGCLPVSLHYHDLKPEELDKLGCIKSQNDFAIEFNRQLKKRVIRLRKELPDAVLTYIDMYTAKYELIGNARQEGFLDAADICCGFHEDDIHVYCGNKLKLNGTEIYAGTCEDPSKYISWDGVHYTDAANRWIASRIINGSFSVPPVTLKHACHKPRLQ